MSTEHRRAPRYPVRLSAELRMQSGVVTGMTRNLSSGGVCLKIDRPLGEGAAVQLKLFIVEDDVEAEGARGLELSGTVQWTAEADDGYTVGLQFQNLSPQQKTAIENAIRNVEAQ